MTCIKTGARVLFSNYGTVLSADLFSVQDTIVIRTHPNSIHAGSGWDVSQATHVVESNVGGGNEFWRDDIGVFVVPASNVRVLSQRPQSQTTEIG